MEKRKENTQPKFMWKFSEFSVFPCNARIRILYLYIYVSRTCRDFSSVGKVTPGRMGLGGVSLILVPPRLPFLSPRKNEAASIISPTTRFLFHH